MPQKICEKCWETVEQFISFRDKCIMSETSLRETVSFEINVLKMDIPYKTKYLTNLSGQHGECKPKSPRAMFW